MQHLINGVKLHEANYVQQLCSGTKILVNCTCCLPMSRHPCTRNTIILEMDILDIFVHLIGLIKLLKERYTCKRRDTMQQVKEEEEEEVVA